MSDQPEPLSAILAEMRDGIHTGRADIIDAVNERLRSYADRIKAAVKREREEARPFVGVDIAKDKPTYTCVEIATGNAAAMRAALKESTALLAVVRGDEYEETITQQIDRNTDVLSAPPEPPSNAAAMRAALNSIADIAKDVFGGPERHREASQGRALSLIVDAARAALSAPARNCDRFATELDARLAWKRETHCKCDYRYWLFEDEKKEGGSHA